MACSTVGDHLGVTFLWGGVPLVAVLTGINTYFRVSRLKNLPSAILKIPPH